MAMTLITTNEPSGAATSDFTSGIDSTYKLYIFKWFDMNPVSDTQSLTFQANVAGQSGFNETVTNSTWRVIQMEADGPEGPQYTDYDQAQGTAYNYLTGNTGGDADQCSVGALYLFNPSNTTYVTHWYSRAQGVISSDGIYSFYTAGYFNVTGAIDEISFKMTVGNINTGTIKMYGVG